MCLSKVENMKTAEDDPARRKGIGVLMDWATYQLLCLTPLQIVLRDGAVWATEVLTVSRSW
jgi:hypothetical protein